MNTTPLTPDPAEQKPAAPDPGLTPPDAPTTPLPGAAEAQAPRPAAHDERSQEAEVSGRNGPRTSPIVWGALILAFCAFVAQLRFSGSTLDANTWLILTTIGLGVLLLVVGAVVLIRNRSPRR